MSLTTDYTDLKSGLSVSSAVNGPPMITRWHRIRHPIPKAIADIEAEVVNAARDESLPSFA